MESWDRGAAWMRRFPDASNEPWRVRAIPSDPSTSSGREFTGREMNFRNAVAGFDGNSQGAAAVAMPFDPWHHGHDRGRPRLRDRIQNSRRPGQSQEVQTGDGQHYPFAVFGLL